MTSAGNVLAQIGDYDLIELAISDTYSNSAANREQKRAGEPRFSAKGNAALFVTLGIRPRKGPHKGSTFTGVSNIVVPA